MYIIIEPSTIMGIFKLRVNDEFVLAEEGKDYVMDGCGVAMKNGIIFQGYEYFGGVKIREHTVRDNEYHQDNMEWDFNINIRPLNIWEERYPMFITFYKKILGKKKVEYILDKIKKWSDFL